MTHFDGAFMKGFLELSYNFTFSVAHVYGSAENSSFAIIENTKDDTLNAIRMKLNNY